MKMTDMYKISIKEHRVNARRLLTANEKTYNSLTDKESPYAIAIKALLDLHRQVYEIYSNAPSTYEEIEAASDG